MLLRVPADYDPQSKKLSSFVTVAPDCDFPIQNLPYGVFSDQGPARIGVAIGDQVLDLALLEKQGLLSVAGGESVFSHASLNPFIRLGKKTWQETRARISWLLHRDNPELRDNPAVLGKALLAQKAVTMHLPIEITGYTDFFSSKEHAQNTGRMFRNSEQLNPNWLYVPIAYNGRVSSIVVSGTPLRRPLGQIKLPEEPGPRFMPSDKLDYEFEMGTVIGKESVLGAPLTMAEAREFIFGFVLFNDWSARDIQAWEYVPLGPFLGKAFGTTISPWIVTEQALSPFKVQQPEQTPEPLAYLKSDGLKDGYDVTLEAFMKSRECGDWTTICRSNFKHMYWSATQQVCHHASGGCKLRVGEIYASGTLSGPEEEARGSLLELSWNGSRKFTLDSGAERTFLQDGDSIKLTARAQGDGYTVGFGECVGEILPALDPETLR